MNDNIKSSLKYRYLHIFGHKEYKFSKKLIAMFHAEREHFDLSEHLFVVCDSTAFDELRQFERVVLYERSVIEILHKFGGAADWIIVHALNCTSTDLLLKYPRKYARKTIWRVWGHDVYVPHYAKGQHLKNALRWCLQKLVRRKIRSFKMLGVAGLIDRLQCEKLYGKMNIMRALYGYEPGLAKLHQDAIAYGEGLARNSLRIMVGHSGYPVDHQLAILSQLEQYKNENLTVVIMVPYGNEECIRKTVTYAKKKFGDKAEIVDRLVPYADYLKYLQTIDVAIMDQETAAALGTISLLLRYKKKLYLNKNGIIHQAFEAVGLKHYCTEDINRQSFKEFATPCPIDPDILKRSELLVQDEQECIACWKKILEALG